MSDSSERIESFLSYHFGIEIDGIESAKFMKCEGLEAETYIYEVEEGGLNTNTHKFFGRTRYPNIVLENGLTDNNDLWEWYKNTVLTEEAVERKSGSIVLYNAGGEEIKRWDFVRGIPCRWIGPTLGKDAQGVAIEKIEIAHEGLTLNEG